MRSQRLREHRLHRGPEPSRSNTAGPTINTTAMPALAADLVRRPVSMSSSQPARAVAAWLRKRRRQQSRSCSQRRRSGQALVWSPASARPGGNVTGSCRTQRPSLVAKRLELLREIVPAPMRMLASWSIPTNPGCRAKSRTCSRGAAIWACESSSLRRQHRAEIDAGLRSARRSARASAPVVSADAFFNSRREPTRRAGGSAMRCRRSTSGANSPRSAVSMSYGPEHSRRLSPSRQSTSARILKGEKPGRSAGRCSPRSSSW